MLNYALAIFFSITSFYLTDKNIHSEFDSMIKKSGILYGNGEIQNAITLASNAREFAITHNYEWGKSKSLFALAFFHHKNQSYEKAVPYYFELLNNYDDIGSQEAYKEKCKVYLNLGNIMLDHSKFHESIKYYNLGISIAKKYSFIDLHYSLINNKINTYIDLKDYDSAITALEVTANLLQMNNVVRKLKGLNQSGLINDGLKESKLARTIYQKIIDLEVNDPTPRFTGTALINIASSYYDEGSYQMALQYYEKALTISKAYNEIADIFLVYLSYAKVYLKTNELTKASQYAKKAEALYPEVNQIKENIEIFSLLSDIHFEMNDIEQGKAYAKTNAAELTALFDRQQKLTDIGSQYKMDYITSSYFAEKEKKKNTHTFIWVIITMVLSFLVFRLYQLYKKIMVGRLLRKEMESVHFDLSDL